MGSSPSPSDRNDPYLRIHAINIFVRDQERSLRFYVDQLGFDLAFDAELQSGDRWIAVAPPDGSAELSLIAPKPDSREFALIGRSAQVVLVTEDVTARYAEWRKRGVQFQHTPRLRRVKFERPLAKPSTDASTPLNGPAPLWLAVFNRYI